MIITNALCITVSFHEDQVEAAYQAGEWYFSFDIPVTLFPISARFYSTVNLPNLKS
jgi:hypothetical protein